MTRELFAFLAITFAATYLLEIFVIMQEGSGILSSKWVLIPMYIPAVGAILCMVGFKSKALTKQSKQFLAMFLLASAVTLVEGLYQPLLGTIGPLPLLTAIISVAAFLLVLLQNLKASGRRSLSDSKLSFGHNYRYYLIIPVIFSVLFILAYFMIHMLGLSLPTMEYSPGSFFVFIGMSVLTFVITWPKYFGEEYRLEILPSGQGICPLWRLPGSCHCWDRMGLVAPAAYARRVEFSRHPPCRKYHVYRMDDHSRYYIQLCRAEDPEHLDCSPAACPHGCLHRYRERVDRKQQYSHSISADSSSYGNICCRSHQVAGMEG